MRVNFKEVISFLNNVGKKSGVGFFFREEDISGKIVLYYFVEGFECVLVGVRGVTPESVGCLCILSCVQ